MLYLSAADVRAALPMAEAIGVMRGAFQDLSSGRAVSPPRQGLVHQGCDGVTLVMPAALPEACSVKVVSVHPRNRGGKHPVVQGMVMLIDPTNGVPQAILEGTALTALRTGAASGLATQLLARAGARTAAFIGAGAQSRTQFAAVAAVRRLDRVWIHDRTREKAEALARELAAWVEAEVAGSAAEAIREADIVCTATTSPTPVLDGRDLRAGCHVNAIGSFQPAMQEIDTETLRRAKIVVDSREAAWLEAGDLIVARGQGLLGERDVHAELGEIALGRRPGRETEEEITLFKSVGNAVQDAAAALAIYQGALELGLGRPLD